MPIKIIYNNFEMLSDARDRLDLVLRACEHVLPWWLNELSVIFDNNTDRDYISTKMHPEYRFGYLHVSPEFLSQDASTWREKITHEFAHALTWPIKKYVEEVIIPVIKNDTIENILKEELRMKIEACTEDISILLSKERK